jgi:tRNA-Thr(GGU) m(6)t(6)A37 methyltransferase TsaA
VDRELRFIGVVRSEIKDRKQIPAFGAPASVELHPEYADGLRRIEKHSHIWVLAWLMARPERDVLQVVPRGVDPASADPMHGVFSVRSPARPNPIGMTSARLLRVDGLRLDLDYLDFLDGTPVLDIKPYFVPRDLLYSAVSWPIGRPRNQEALREGLLFQVRNYMLADHPDVALAVRVMEHYRVEVAQWVEPAKYELVLPVDRPYFVDAMVAMTRVRMSAGLSFGDVVSVNGVTYDLGDFA